MKKWLYFLLAAVMLLGGCSGEKTLTPGKNNDKLVGAWVIINDDTGRVRYWEFRSDGTAICCESIRMKDSDTPNDQLVGEAPFGYAGKVFYMDETGSHSNEVYTYSYTEGYGLELKDSTGAITNFTVESDLGWNITFLNDNLFELVSETPTLYYGCRLKEPMHDFGK